MISIKRKIAFLLILVLISSLINVRNNYVYAAVKLQLKVTLNNFDNNDNLKSSNTTIQTGANTTFNNIHISTPIKIDFQNFSGGANVNLKTNGNLNSFVSLTEEGDNTNLIGSLLNDATFNKNGFSTITLSPVSSNSFKSDKKYTLTVNTANITEQNGTSLTDNGIYTIILNSEKTPKVVSMTPEYNKLKISFDRKIDTSNINLSNINIFFKDENGGSQAQDQQLNNVAKSVSAEPQIQTSTTSSILIEGINPNGIYTVTVNKNVVSVSNIVRNKSTSNTNPSISNPKDLAVENTVKQNIEVKYNGFKVSKSIELKKSTTSNTSSTITLNNSQSASNTDIDVDSVINGNKIIINLETPNNKSLFMKDNSAVSITNPPTNTQIIQSQNSETFRRDKIEITADSSLSPDKEYTITIDKSKFLYNNDNNMPSGEGKEIYKFKTEKKPTFQLNTKNIERGVQDSKLSLTLSRPVEQVNSNDDLKTKIELKDSQNSPIPIKSVELVSKNTLNITLDNTSSSALGEASIKILSDTFKRDGSISLKADEFTDKFKLSMPSEYLKAKFEIQNFSNSDELSDFSKDNIPTVALNTSSSSESINNVFIDSDIKIKFNVTVKAKIGKNIDDILKLSENGVEKRISDYYEIAPSDISAGFDTLTLTSKKPLESAVSYILTVDNSQMLDNTYNAPLGDTKFAFTLNTEKKPSGQQGEEVNKNYVVTFDRKIDLPLPSDIKLFKLNEFGQYSEFSGISSSDLQLIDEKTIVIKNLPNGKYKIKLNSDTLTIKRKTAPNHKSDLYAKEFLGASIDENSPDFEIKSLASTVSDYIRLKKYEQSGSKTVQISKVGENNTNNTEIETDTSLNVKFTIPYKYTNDAFAIVPASNTTAASLSIKSITKNTSSLGTTEGVTIELNENLNPDTEYKLILYKNKFTNSQNSLAGNIGETEEYNFTTETSPKLISSDMPKVEKKLTEQTINLRFDKNIEISDLSKININGSTAFTSATASDNTLSLSLSKELANSLDIKEHNINIGAGSLKRKNSKNVYVKEISKPLNVVEDQIKKAEEDAKKKTEEDAKKAQEEQLKAIQQEREVYRNAVANALVDEIQKRYQAEYGSDYDFKSFNDYIKDKYIKEKGTSYKGSDYIQAYLKDYGYVDDFISKYGRNSNDITSHAKDYLNRYGSFAYSDKEKYNNPLFMNPFRDGSNKRGYYDYYNKYDYGYKYPEMRVGDDNISQANLEKEQKLKQKEAELIARERGYAIQNAQSYSPTANNSPKIIINKNSRYFTQEDEYGNRISIDMGVSPTVSNGRLFVAVTPLANKLGLWVSYDNATKTTTLSKPNSTVALSPNSSYITINGKSENMGIRPINRNNKLMIPAHYIAKAFGLDSSKVVYDENTITINNY